MTLGIPIPFSSLGMIIPEVFLPYQESDSDSKNHLDNSYDDGFSGRVTTEFLVALRENAQQIQRYLMTYAQHSDDFPSDVFRSLQSDLDRAVELHKKILEEEAESKHPSQEALTNVAAAYVGYMREVKVMCQSIWAKFDDVSITKGLILLLLSVTFVPLMLIDVANSARSLRKALPYGAVSGLGVIAVLALFTSFVQLELTFSGILSLVLNFSLYTLATTIVVHMLLMSLAVFQCLKDSLHGGNFTNQISVLQLLSVAITILYGVAMLSNSFVLYEADMVSFFLHSMLVCFTVRSLQVEFNGDTNLELNKVTLTRATRTAAPSGGALVCVRLVKIFYACRDLQIQDGCTVTTFIHALPVAYQFLGGSFAVCRMVLSCTAISAIPIGFLLFVQRSSGARHLSQWMHYVAKYAFLVAVFCVCGFWLLLCLPQTDLERLTPWKHVILPRIVYLISAVAMVICIVMPFKRVKRILTMNYEETPANLDTGTTLGSSDCVQRERDSLNDAESSLGRPRMRRQRPGEAEPVSHFSQEADIRVIHPSLAGVIPLTNLFLLMALWIPAALLLNDSIALSAVVMATQVALTVKGLRDKESGTII